MTIIFGSSMDEHAYHAAQAAVRRLDALTCGDPEAAHGDADKTLLAFIRELGWGEVADAWKRADERVGFWYA